MKKVLSIALSLIGKLTSLCSLLFLCSLLMNFYGPNYLQNFLSRNTTSLEIQKTKTVLPTPSKSLDGSLSQVLNILTLNFGYSHFHRDSVFNILKRAFVTTISIMIPGFLGGVFLAFSLCFLASLPFKPLLKTLGILLLLLNSLHEVSLILIVKMFLCTDFGLEVFPLQGWKPESISSYLHYASVPIFIISLSFACLYTPLFHSAFLKEGQENYNKTLLALGCPKRRIFFIYQLKRALIPILQHLARIAPLSILGGSLIIENHFNIPGIAFIAYESSLAGDSQTLLAIIAFVGASYLLCAELLKKLLQKIDPLQEKIR